MPCILWIYLFIFVLLQLELFLYVRYCDNKVEIDFIFCFVVCFVRIIISSSIFKNKFLLWIKKWIGWGVI